MSTFQISGATLDAQAASSSTTPMVVLFERDDAVAVPLLSQLRLAGYDVRASRTPVELFDLLSKHLVSLVLVDLGNATAGRREFWVALDAQRRGRAMQVMTFRYLAASSPFDMDFEPTSHAIADIDIHGAHEFQKLIDGVRQRIPLHGVGNGGSAPNAAAPQGYPAPGIAQPAPGMPGMPEMPGAAFPGMLPGGIAPIGAALGVPSPFMQPGGFGQPQPSSAAYGSPFAISHEPPAQSAFMIPGVQPGFSPLSAPSAGASPFANPVSANPFTTEQAESSSPFAQPLAQNPFADAAESDPRGKVLSHPFTAPEIDPRGARGGFIPDQRPSMSFAPEQSSPAPWGASSPNDYGYDGAARRGFASFGSPETPGRNRDSYGNSGNGGNGAQIADVWTPPDGEDEFDRQTGVVPEITYQALNATARRAPQAPQSPHSDRSDRYDRYDDANAPDDRDQFGSHASYERERLPREETAPIPVHPSRVPMVRPEAPADRALGSVLVEGALITPNKLDVLKGIQQMLASVEVDLRLGELALLFKFLSPDQLLAALLVSRGIVSPEQIAGLGRVKQELAGSGMDYDLETLLVMFHIMPADQLRQLRAELA